MSSPPLAEGLPQRSGPSGCRAAIAQSNASDVPFGFGTSETLQSNIPVAEQETITYNDGSTQTESILEIPNTADNTVTTYKTIDLRNNGGTETVVQTEAYSPGPPTVYGATIPFLGDHRTFTITTTLPNGSTETETEAKVIMGHKFTESVTIDKPSGVETQSVVEFKNGPTTTAKKTIVETDGSVEHQKTVTTDRGEFDSTTTTTTILPDGTVQRSSSATDIIRVQPPSS